MGLKVIQALVRHDAASFSVRRLDHYLPEGAELPSEVSWWDIMRRVRQNSDDLMIAWRAKSKPHEPWTVNPNDKTAKVPWRDSDRIVVVSNDHVQCRCSLSGSSEGIHLQPFLPPISLGKLPLVAISSIDSLFAKT